MDCPLTASATFCAVSASVLIFATRVVGVCMCVSGLDWRVPNQALQESNEKLLSWARHARCQVESLPRCLSVCLRAMTAAESICVQGLSVAETGAFTYTLRYVGGRGCGNLRTMNRDRASNFRYLNRLYWGVPTLQLAGVNQ